MLRRVMLAFAILALALTACGRQVTPDRIYAGTAGEMSITFQTYGPMDFTHFNYLIVFNTSGVGTEPYPTDFENSYCNYSFLFGIGARLGSGSVTTPYLYQIYVQPGATVPTPNYINLNPGSTTITAPTSNEFTLTFARSQLDLASPVTGNANNCGNPPTPSPSPVPTASPTPTATPTGPTPVPTATPVPTPSPAASPIIWFINLMTTDQNGVILDSMGPGGPTDRTFQLSEDVTKLFSDTRQRTELTPPSNPAAYIESITIINNP
jgi:hypothetical protein